MSSQFGRQNPNGGLIFSLDFELMWGVRDKRTVADYGANILGARKAIPKMLDMFASHDVSATWATVGLLFYEDKDELLAGLPDIKPQYKNANLSPYDHVNSIGDNEKTDPYHYGLSLIRRIAQTPRQEIASHSFSHLYSLEEGMTDDAFAADLNAAIAVAADQNINIKSFVFPRNQINLAHVKICQSLGLNAYRGTESSRLFSPQNAAITRQTKRLGRLVDTYANLSGHHGFCAQPSNDIVNLPSSRFLRPFSISLRRFESRRIGRILKSMRHCAQRSEFFHIWTHPHNFGVNQDDNFAALSQILEYAAQLKKEFGWPSYSMEDAAALIAHNR